MSKARPISLKPILTDFETFNLTDTDSVKFINLPIFTDTDFLTDTDFNLGGGGSPYPPKFMRPDTKYSLRQYETLFFAKTKIWQLIYELHELIKNPLDRFIIYRFIPIPIPTDSWDF